MSIEFLKQRVDVFRDFSDERLQELVNGARVEAFEANEAIVHYGAQATHLGVVLSGTVAASTISEGARQTLGQLNAGDIFGEMALLSGDTMLADFIAESPCKVLLIPVSLFQSIIVAEPHAVARISQLIAQKITTLMADPAKAAAALRCSEDPYGLNLKGERPEKILAVNCGSSSLKYCFYDTAEQSRSARGLVERVGLEGTCHKYSGPKGKLQRELAQSGFAGAFEAMLNALTAKETGVIQSRTEVSLVAHRVVHGGERFTEGTLITDEVLAEIETLNPLAPMHNPLNVAAIREMRRLFPSVPHVAVFDTAFHHTLPAYAYLYGAPYELYKHNGVRRYGFHGTSHHYVALRAAEFLKRRPNELRVVSCHLGNGSSMCALDHGRSMDTSMGFTPAEGLIMGTRCGDVDIGVLAFLDRTQGLTATQSEQMLNSKGGLLGLSGLSSDMREILKAASEDDHRALLTLKTYCYRVRKYIGAYVAAMGGLDAIVFTGGIGQGSPEVRALALQGLDCMGIALDDQRNRDARGSEQVCLISGDDSKAAVLVVPSDEERMMAHEALRAASRHRLTRVLASQPRMLFPVEVRADHVHLTQAQVEALFGEGYTLTRQTDLMQPGQYVCKEQVALAGPKGRLEGVSVFGPAREFSQVEIGMTGQFALGVHPPTRTSGDVADTPGCVIEGPAGNVSLDCGVISPWRHLHMKPEDALRYGVRDRAVVAVRIGKNGEAALRDVLVHVDANARLAMHVDADEAKVANLRSGALGYITEIQNEG